MALRDLARLFIRFQALIFLFYALYEFTYFPSAYRSFQTVHEFRELDSVLAQDFWMLVLRIALQLAAAVFLFGWTERLINLLLKGASTANAEPPSPHEETKG